MAIAQTVEEVTAKDARDRTRKFPNAECVAYDVNDYYDGAALRRPYETNDKSEESRLRAGETVVVVVVAAVAEIAKCPSCLRRK